MTKKEFEALKFGDVVSINDDQLVAYEHNPTAKRILSGWYSTNVANKSMFCTIKKNELVVLDKNNFKCICEFTNHTGKQGCLEFDMDILTPIINREIRNTLDEISFILENEINKQNEKSV